MAEMVAGVIAYAVMTGDWIESHAFVVAGQEAVREADVLAAGQEIGKIAERSAFSKISGNAIPYLSLATEGRYARTNIFPDDVASMGRFTKVPDQTNIKLSCPPLTEGEAAAYMVSVIRSIPFSGFLSKLSLLKASGIVVKHLELTLSSGMSGERQIGASTTVLERFVIPESIFGFAFNNRLVPGSPGQVLESLASSYPNRMVTNSFVARELGVQSRSFTMAASLTQAVAFYRSASLAFELDGDSSSDTINSALGLANLTRGSPWSGFGSIFGPKLTTATGAVYRAFLDLSVELTTKSLEGAGKMLPDELGTGGVKRVLALPPPEKGQKDAEETHMAN